MHFYELQALRFIDRLQIFTRAIYRYIHTDQYLVDRIVDEHGDVHVLSVFLEQLIDQLIGALAERSGESLKNVKMEGRLKDFPVYLPLIHLPRDQTLTKKIVQQLVKKDLARVLHTAQHHLDVLRLHEHDVRQKRYPYPENTAVTLRLVCHSLNH